MSRNTLSYTVHYFVGRLGRVFSALSIAFTHRSCGGLRPISQRSSAVVRLRSKGAQRPCVPSPCVRSPVCLNFAQPTVNRAIGCCGTTSIFGQALVHRMAKSEQAKTEVCMCVSGVPVCACEAFHSKRYQRRDAFCRREHVFFARDRNAHLRW